MFGSPRVESEDERRRLEGFERASVPELVEWLRSGTARDQADAACALGDRLRSAEVDGLEADTLDALADLLGHQHPGPRLEAAIALAQARDRRATETLLEELVSSRNRLDAIRALGASGDLAAREPLRALLHRWLMPWADKLQAAAALCALGEGEGADYLEARLTSRRGAERSAAIHFLGEAHHPRARSQLEAMAAEPLEPLRDVAVRALGLLGDPNALPTLERIAAQGGDELAEDARQAIARLGGKKRDLGST